MFLLFCSLILRLISALISTFSIRITVSFSFYFLLLDLLEFCHELSPDCKACLYIFNSQRNECYPIQTKGHNICSSPYKIMLISAKSFSADVFILFLSLALLNVGLSSCNLVNIFSIVVHVFRNLF